MGEQQSIAFICHPYHRGGVTRWMADAAVAAAGKGMAVYFVTVEPTAAFFSAGGRETMAGLLRPYAAKVKLISRKVNFLFEFGTEAHRANMYRQLITENVPEGTPLIVSDDEAVWCAAASVADKYRMVGVLHGDQDYYYDKAIKYGDQLSLCICVSGRVKRHALAKCPRLPVAKVRVVPCGIDMPAFVPTVTRDNATRLIFIGRLTDYEKRAEDLVHISALLHEQGFSFHLDIVGNSDSSKVDFGKKFRERCVETFVTFHGWQGKEGVQRLLNGADILLLTSNSEGMPLTMMEALASGCGFVGTRVSGIEDYEQDARAGGCFAVYEVGDVADAADKIKRVASVQAVQRQATARSLAEAEFSMQVCLQRYRDAIAAIQPMAITPWAIKYSLADALYSGAMAIGRNIKMNLRSG